MAPWWVAQSLPLREGGRGHLPQGEEVAALGGLPAASDSPAWTTRPGRSQDRVLRPASCAQSIGGKTGECPPRPGVLRWEPRRSLRSETRREGGPSELSRAGPAPRVKGCVPGWLGGWGVSEGNDALNLQAAGSPQSAVAYGAYFQMVLYLFKWNARSRAAGSAHQPPHGEQGALGTLQAGLGEESSGLRGCAAPAPALLSDSLP